MEAEGVDLQRPYEHSLIRSLLMYKTVVTLRFQAVREPLKMEGFAPEGL